MDHFDFFHSTNVEKLKKFNINPKDVYKKLGESIIGQDEAKKKVSIAAMVQHMKKLKDNCYIQYAGDVVSNNILMIGPTGSGKTAIIKKLASILEIPLTIIDVTSITASGYVGESINSIFERHVKNTYHFLESRQQGYLIADMADPMVIEEAERGIIYLDEIDKLRASHKSGSRSVDVSGEGVQYELLKILEGQQVQVELNKERNIAFDTSKLLCVCSGAFSGIEKIVEQRVNKDTSVGFTSKQKQGLAKAQARLDIRSEDVIKYGMIPEIVGRLPIIAGLQYLTKQDLKDIMKYSDNSVVLKYKNFYKAFELQLEITEYAYDYIAEQAMKEKTGARALNGILSQILENKIFELMDFKDTDVVKITKEHVENILKDY